jgi:hypothetical protein
MREGYRVRIEMDESYFGVGGRRKGIRGREYLARVPVFGIFLVYLRSEIR